jgi:hypothetical protein
MLATSCGEDSGGVTQTVVIVDAEPGVRAATRVLVIEVNSLGADGPERVKERTLRAEDGELEWPWLLGLVPKDDDATREFEVVATARDADDGFVAQARARSGFVKGEKRALMLLLQDACIGVDGCADDETCHDGECADAYVDPLSLPAFDESDVPERVVVGPADEDGGPRDDGSMVMPMVDAGGEGGLKDAEVEVDAQASPGCRPNPDPTNEVCPEICPEACNGEDDDCDNRIDEEEADEDCDSLDHAVGACTLGECAIVQCQKDWRDCDEDPVTGCETGNDDVNHCGKCNQPCAFPNMIPACMDDECVPIGCIDLFDDCDADPEDCETPTTTLIDCGGCGISCEDVPHADPTCMFGYCGPGMCIGNYGDCNDAPGDGCELELNLPTDCTACGQACDFPGSTEDCSTGVCLATGCTGNYDDCDLDPSNGCESLETDADCEACGQVCDATLAHVDGAGCTPGGCVVDCADGFGDCDDDAFNGCEDAVNTNERCGDCDTPCEIPNAVVSCETGTCEFVRCAMGWGDCANGLTDGCEQDLSVIAHCGACNNNCASMVGMTHCSGGQCSAVDCSSTPGMADCDGLNGDCETDTTTDENHCGACDFPCEFDAGVTPNATGPTCVASQCVAQCDATHGDCNMNYLDGCEKLLTTLTDCGGCGDGCSIPNATPTCDSGDCEVESCATDYDDCDDDGVTCETSLATTNDCSACDVVCNLPNAVETCGGSPGARMCLIAQCTDAFYQDCDDLDATGCEIDTRTNALHCGACDHDCAAEPNVMTASCSGSACVYDQCDSGFGDCNGQLGCETPLGTDSDCSACRDNCGDLPNTKETACASMACDITSCDTGFDDCDGSDATGCETNIFSAANCGGCASADANEPCTNLPNVAQSSCPAGDCVIDACVGSWLDCDGVVANGCEHNGAAPGVGGGLGPCEPDTNCVKQTNLGQTYWFCTNDRMWPIARSRCQLQLLGDLVRIDSPEENTFLQGFLTEGSWIGASDAATEGQWRWADNNVQFWMGGPAPGGGPVTGNYANWLSTEPNNGNNSDCARIALSGGTWLDEDCGTTRGFVCEIQADLCPDDPKTHPGQCGCSVPDDDTDGDGTADCNDGCPNDPLKVAPGVCLCGVPDVDSDVDGVLDCQDQCPGAPDVDTDGDALLDCADPCPYAPGSGPEAGLCAYNYAPSNFTPGAIDFSGAPNSELDCDLQINTTDPDGNLGPGVVTLTGWCGPSDKPTFQVYTQDAGIEVVVMPLASLSLAEGASLRVIGNRPLIIAAMGDVEIMGTINARALGTTAGAGGNASCTNGLGANGTQAGMGSEGGGGGGGGAFAEDGGDGGNGYRLLGSVPGGNGGTPEGVETLTPLRGGCRGGTGGRAHSSGGAMDSVGGFPGAGGGAIQISAAGMLSISATGIVTVSGGGGLKGADPHDGGGGGGSGGALLLEGAAVEGVSGSWATANGGGGASGSGSASGGNHGTDGFTASGVNAPGGVGVGNGGGGGRGGAQAGKPDDGSNGTGSLGTGGGGGGGGGGVGRIVVRGIYACALHGNASPRPSAACP